MFSKQRLDISYGFVLFFLPRFFCCVKMGEYHLGKWNSVLDMVFEIYSMLFWSLKRITDEMRDKSSGDSDGYQPFRVVKQSENERSNPTPLFKTASSLLRAKKNPLASQPTGGERELKSHSTQTKENIQPA